MAPGDQDRWHDLRNRLLRELCHDLNGRASALRGLAELQAGYPSLGDPLALLQEEADRLEELALNLALLSEPRDRGSDLLELEPLVHRCSRAITVLEELAGGHLEVLSAVGDPPPIRATATLVNRLLLVAMEQVLVAAGRAGVERPSAQVVGHDGGAEVRFLLRHSPNSGGVGAEVLSRPWQVDGLEVAWSWRSDASLGELRLRFPPP